MGNDLLQVLRDSRNTAPVAYTEFILTFSESTKTLYCFFEGYEDKRYYGTRIRFIYQTDFKNFTCGGKESVTKVIELINNHEIYKNSKTLFFIDKDYSNKETKENLYVTPGYSIENFYTSKEVLEKILIDEFNMKTADNDFTLIVERFQHLQNEFHNETLLFNAWLACQHDYRVTHQSETHLSIDDTVKKYFQGIVKEKLGGIKKLKDLNNLDFIKNSLFPEAPIIDEAALDEKIEQFKTIEQRCAFRGKFEIRFFISFVQQLKNEIGKQPSKSMFEKKRKCTLEFKPENVISTLTQYAVTSDCLNDFLRTNLQSA